MFTRVAKYADGTEFHQIELDGYFLDYIHGSNGELVITFENADNPSAPRPNGGRLPWGGDVLRRRGYNVLGIKPKFVDWYRGPDLHAFFRSEEFSKFVKSFSQVFLYGSSMGGYAALAFAEACPGSVVIAYNPQVTLDPAIAGWDDRYSQGTSQDWTGDFSSGAAGAKVAKTVFVAYDPYDRKDSAHINLLETSNIVPLKFFFVGHVVASWMQEAGVLSEFLNGALSQTLTASSCRALARARRKTARHYIVLSSKARNATLRCSLLSQAAAVAGLPRAHQLSIQRILLGSLPHPLPETLLARLAEFDDDILCKIAKSMSDQGMVKDALSVCETASGLRRLPSDILALRGECLLRLNRLDEACVSLEAAIAADAANANARRIFARVHHAAARKHEAMLACQFALSLEPGSFNGWRDLAIYAEDCGDLWTSLKAAEAALRLKPQDAEMTMKLASLNSIELKY